MSDIPVGAAVAAAILVAKDGQRVDTDEVHKETWRCLGKVRWHRRYWLSRLRLQQLWECNETDMQEWWDVDQVIGGD